MSFFRRDRRETGVAWIAAFLGNPGLRYKNTRHNAGFMVCDELAKKLGVRVDRLKFKALTGTCDIAGTKVLLMKPQTFMNLSGDAVREAMKFYKIPPERLLVVSDEAALPAGKLRIRRSGSAGGHNGLKDIIAKCGGEGFPRLRVGVGSPENPEMDLADHVLGAYHGRELEEAQETARRAADAVVCIVSEGAERAMEKFN
ncbi:MAG: aminoacyl-tRNA hydrolase [Oscillospiraceae bacterium]|jgi:PTH1 family peptidyl-tRNA hydrolase|nr:aminoacyl-tRNA hydrolase [Oscillospiraceae bacterium]